MSNQPESASYDLGVYQLEIADSVDGGVGAKSNAPLLSLANRTAYLKQHLDAIEAGTFVPTGFALLASPAFTGTPTAPTQAAGDNSTKLATDAFVQTTVNGNVAVSIAGSATTTLTQAQYGPAIITLTGAVTGNKAVVFPNITGHWQVLNNSTGAFTVTLKTAAGTGVVLTNGMSSNIYCDGTNVTLQQTDFISPALTGTPTAPTAVTATNTTQLATTAFVQQELANELATVAPLMSGAAAVGVSAKVARQDHIHPTDTSRAPLASPALTGTPTAPTGATGDNSTQLATDAFVNVAVNGQATIAMAATGNTTMSAAQYGVNALNLTGTLTGNVTLTLPATTGEWTFTNSTTGAFTVTLKSGAGTTVLVTQGQTTTVLSDGTNVRLIQTDFISPALTGTPTAPTATPGTNTTQLATTAFVAALGALKANLASPTFTGAPAAPTPTPGDNSTQLATTAFVTNAVSGSGTVPGQMEWFATMAPPAAYLAANGSAVSRATYAALFAAITAQVAGTVTSGSNSITGVTSPQSMWVGMTISGPGIPAGATVTAAAGSTITLSANATATSTTTVYVCPFGVGDGSTTFNVPDGRGVDFRGWDNGRGLDASRVFGSYQADMLGSHAHGYGVGVNIQSGTGNTVIQGGITPVATTANTGGVETRGKNIALLPCIKY